MARRGYTFQQQNSAFATHKEARYSNHISTKHHQVAGFLDQGCLIGGGSREAATWHSHSGFIIPNNALIINNGSNSLLNTSLKFSNFGAAAMRDSEFGTFGEVRGPPHGTVRTEEMRYERRSWGGDGSNYGYFNDVDGFNNNMNRNGFTRVEWISKGF